MRYRTLKIGAALIASVLLFAVWWLVLRPRTADEVAQMTAQALARGDIDTLLNLTLPEEREKLHLTREGVRGMLTETLYSHGTPGKYTVKRVQDHPVDQLLYEINPVAANTKSLRYPLALMITQSRDNRWHLPLGYLLLNVSVMDREPQDISEVYRRFWELADRYDIRGLRLNTWGYSMRSDPKR